MPKVVYELRQPTKDFLTVGQLRNMLENIPDDYDLRISGLSSDIVGLVSHERKRFVIEGSTYALMDDIPFMLENIYGYSDECDEKLAVIEKQIHEKTESTIEIKLNYYGEGDKTE